MDINTQISGSEQALLEQQVNTFNKTLAGTRSAQKNMDKDDFLKILITQLKYQDPTKPMEDKEFIAQMAQFSSLEQITNMSRQFTDLTTTLKSSQAVSLVGKNVEIITQGDKVVQGTVDAVTGNEYPQVMVNGIFYDYDKISKVMR